MAPKAGTSKEEGEWRAASAAADALGITAQAIGMWASRPGCPMRTANGKRFYKWPDFPRWREKELERQAKSEAAPKSGKDSMERKLAAEARMAEIELAAIEGKYVTVEDAARSVEGMLEQLRAQLLTLPQRWSPNLVGVKTVPDALQRLEAAVRETLEALSA
jgi:hypothetical protein